jgi:hypothetical protein
MTTPSQTTLVPPPHTARRRAAWPLLAFLLAAAGLLAAGCESGLDQPATMTPEVRNASEVLPAGVQAVAMVDVAALADEGNPFGGLDLDPSDATHAEALRARDFFASVGFAPEEDLRAVYAAVETLDRARDARRVHFAVYADFDRARIEARLAEEGDLTTRLHEGATIYSRREGGRTMAFAVANDDLLVGATSVAGVEAMLDRLRGQGTEALEDDAALMPLVREASRHQTMWFAARDLPTAALAEEAAAADGSDGRTMARVGRAVRDVAGGVSFTASGGVDGDVALAVRQGTRADDVASLLRGALRTARTQSQKDAVRDALDRVDVESGGDEVRVGFSLSRAAVQSMRDE